MKEATFLFTDIVSSTEMLTMLGEETWLRALRRHNEVVSSAVCSHGASFKKFLGDGWMVVFPDAGTALSAALEIRRSSEEDRSPHGFRLRIGIHSGSALEEQGDLVGKDVVLASRITHEAGAGEIVVSADALDAIAPASRSDGTWDEFDGGRIAHLKGLGPHLVFGLPSATVRGGEDRCALSA